MAMLGWDNFVASARSRVASARDSMGEYLTALKEFFTELNWKDFTFAVGNGLTSIKDAGISARDAVVSRIPKRARKPLKWAIAVAAVIGLAVFYVKRQLPSDNTKAPEPTTPAQPPVPDEAVEDLLEEININKGSPDRKALNKDEEQSFLDKAIKRLKTKTGKDVIESLKDQVKRQSDALAELNTEELPEDRALEGLSERISDLQNQKRESLKERQLQAEKDSKKINDATKLEYTQRQISVERAASEKRKAAERKAAEELKESAQEPSATEEERPVAEQRRATADEDQIKEFRKTLMISQRVTEFGGLEEQLDPSGLPFEAPPNPKSPPLSNDSVESVILVNLQASEGDSEVFQGNDRKIHGVIGSGPAAGLAPLNFSELPETSERDTPGTPQATSPGGHERKFKFESFSAEAKKLTGTKVTWADELAEPENSDPEQDQGQEANAIDTSTFRLSEPEQDPSQAPTISPMNKDLKKKTKKKMH